MTPGSWNRASVTAALQQYLKCISHTHVQGTFSPFLHLTAISKSQKKCFDSATTCVWEGQFVHLLATNLCQNFWGKKKQKTTHSLPSTALQREVRWKVVSEVSCYQLLTAKSGEILWRGKKKKKGGGGGKRVGVSSWKVPERGLQSQRVTAHGLLGKCTRCPFSFFQLVKRAWCMFKLHSQPLEHQHKAAILGSAHAWALSPLLLHQRWQDLEETEICTSTDAEVNSSQFSERCYLTTQRAARMAPSLTLNFH